MIKNLRVVYAYFGIPRSRDCDLENQNLGKNAHISVKI